MKLPFTAPFGGNRKSRPEVFLSLLLYPDAVEAAVWDVSPQGKITIIGAVTQDLTHDSWHERRIAADKCVTTLEDIAQTTNIQKVVLGLPAVYLTKDGDIIKDIKPYVKKLTHDLGLTPIGFVSLYQAIVYKYKKQEGIPPSLILLGFTAGSITVTLYRVGNFSGQVTIPKEGSIAEHLEDALAQFSFDHSVFPSRIILYGTKPSVLEQVKKELMKHHWTARSNFIHFPKIEILSGDGAAIAVSYAGAGELIKNQEMDLGSEFPVDEEDIRTDDVEETEEQFEQEQTEERQEDQRCDNKQADNIEELEIQKKNIPEYHANVVPVDPKALGFSSSEDEEKSYESDAKYHRRRFREVSFPLGRTFRSLFSCVQRTRGRKIVFILPIFILAVFLFLVYFVIDIILPRADITIFTVPRTIVSSETITVDPRVAQVSNSIIPGRRREGSASGEKTVQASGKKTVGEPAKGKITIVNKSTVPRTFKKGTVVSTGGIEFTLDTDVSIASASETFQGITYAKESVGVTAKQIGERGNISAGREFTISGISSTIATARNEQPFSGGKSKDVIVVSRSDHEQIVKDLTQQLTVKAKESFEHTGEETIISDTIKTTITQRVFSAEVGEEVKEVNGKITVKVSGIGYQSSDVATVLKQAVEKNIPQGYVLSNDIPNIQTGNPRIARDGTITIIATISAVTIPNIDLSKVAQDIVGKQTSEAQSILSQLPGVRNVKFSISSLFHKQRLPKRAQNISLRVTTNE
ncbi:MAG: baseplate J/gp47 family protein [Patescibacteria group bacterium]|nr:baseplate J/gp47 family protein [Patescibacteria group bacterium]